MQFWWQLPWIPAVTAGIFISIGLFGAGYYFWRKTNEEHFNLLVTFDGLLYSIAGALVAGRLSYILMRWEWATFSIDKFFNIWQYPGLWTPAGLVAAYAVMAWSARRQKREPFEIWDYYTLALTWFLGWYWLSRLAVGAAAGISTTWPIGVLFPQRVEPAHPVQLYAAVVLLLLFKYLWWAEPRYRFFLWYRSRKRTAKSGYLFAIFLIVFGLAGLLLSFVQYPFLMVLDLDINQIFHVVLFVAGCVVLYIRSGQSFFVKKEKGRNATSISEPTTGIEKTAGTELS